jgi:hypothetical protein
MKKLVKITVSTTTKAVEEIEVEFPIYRRHDIDTDRCLHTIFTKIEHDGRIIHIHRSDENWMGQTKYEVEIERDYEMDGSGKDYCLGLGEYKSSAAEFEEVARELSTAIAAFR